MTFLQFIQAGSPEIGGIVDKVLGSGIAFLTPDMRLPMTNGGTADYFFVPRREAALLREGASVKFQWASPGHPGVDRGGARAAPEAFKVQVVSDEERSQATENLRLTQVMLTALQDALDEGISTEQLIADAESLLSEPATAIPAAFAAYKRAQELVRDREEAERRLRMVQSEVASVEDRLAEIRELQAKAQADEERLAPLREFAASIRYGESTVGPRQPDTPVADPSLDDLESALAPFGTVFLRRTAIVALLAAAIKGRLLLLDGPVGTGKSSFAERVASACGGECEVIPVRPAWVEPSDLLGFYDPMSRVFRPGPFTDAVTSPTADRLHLVVLDEMNLARVENYAADILSRVERIAEAHQVGATPDGIPVWSLAEWQALKAEWDILVALDTPTPETEHRISQLRHTFRYRPRLTPPDGTVLVGTLNTDDTTYDVSPKVIDRSFAIAFPPAVLSTFGGLATAPRLGLSIRKLRDFVLNHRHPAYDSMRRRLLNTVDEETMASVGVPFSYRVIADFECFTSIGRYLDVSEDELLAMFVFSRVLPRIRFLKEGGRNETARTLLERVRGLSTSDANTAWHALISRLDNQCQDERSRVVRFWHAGA